jgi:hypothetical protein
MRRPAALIAALAAVPVLAAAPAWAQDPPATGAAEVGTVSFVLENDLFYNLDRHYTNGVEAAWTSGKAAPAWALGAAAWVPLFPEERLVRTVYRVGQAMFTPDDIEVADPPPGARPYAGWLYASIGLIAESERRLDQLQLTAGVIGPLSLAEPSQKLVHRITGAAQPRGWDTQLKNEPGLVVSYQRSWRSFLSERVAGFGVDVTPHVGGALGNVYTFADAGLTVRLGRHLPRDYGPPRIEPGVPGSGFFVPAERWFGWYLFAGVSGRAVARNIFLDGNTWQDSRSVDRELFVGDLQFGLAATLGDARLTYTHVLRTREFDGQDGGDQFGALAVSWRF